MLAFAQRPWSFTVMVANGTVQRAWCTAAKVRLEIGQQTPPRIVDRFGRGNTDRSIEMVHWSGRVERGHTQSAACGAIQRATHETTPGHDVLA